MGSGKDLVCGICLAVTVLVTLARTRDSSCGEKRWLGRLRSSAPFGVEDLFDRLWAIGPQLGPCLNKAGHRPRACSARHLWREPAQCAFKAGFCAVDIELKFFRYVIEVMAHVGGRALSMSLGNRCDNAAVFVSRASRFGFGMDKDRQACQHLKLGQRLDEVDVPADLSQLQVEFARKPDQCRAISIGSRRVFGSEMVEQPG